MPRAAVEAHMRDCGRDPGVLEVLQEGVPPQQPTLLSLSAADDVAAREASAAAGETRLRGACCLVLHVYGASLCAWLRLLR